MPKTPSSKLFHLVKSLSGAEKRYFKIFINSKDSASSKYALLFDAIDAQAEFDDEVLRQSIYGDEPVETRKYSELKAYLYELVLKSLQAYDEKSSVDYKLKNMLLGVRTLFKRSHFEDCKELLGKAKKVALEYEDFNTLIEILDWEKKIAYTQTDIAFLDREIERINKEEKDYIDRLQQISAYRNIFFKVMVSLRKDVSRSESQKRELSKIIESPLLQDSQLATSFKSKMLYYRSSSLFNFSISNFEEFYNTSKALIALLEENKAILKEDVSEYISALNNHILSCGRTGRIEEFRKTLDKLKKVEPITADDELKIHRQYYLAKFRLCINTGEFEEGLIELNSHLKEVNRFDKKLFIKNSFFLQYFCIYFGVGDYQQALDSLNEWLNMMSNSIERKDLQRLARILNLIIHYELGNTILLDSLIRSTYRYLNKEDRLLEFEKKMMDFIKVSGKPHSKLEIRQLLETLKTDFEQLSKFPSYGVFELFDVISWLESKISGENFASVVKKRYESK